MKLVNKTEGPTACPFCQQKAVTQDYGHMTEMWSVSCLECPARMEGFLTEAGAIAAWNRRAALTPEEFTETALASERLKVARLMEALSDMIAVAEQDEWQKAMTGRQIILKKARAAIAEQGK